ncbi:hypothetical protein C8Q70DRAFT_1052111 [Cubamyces menziesii]|nr:hypothetical protein C8Q70DRAFT_1052111 [Cubamyces menziesii]
MVIIEIISIVLLVLHALTVTPFIPFPPGFLGTGLLGGPGWESPPLILGSPIITVPGVPGLRPGGAPNPFAFGILPIPTIPSPPPIAPTAPIKDPYVNFFSYFLPATAGPAAAGLWAGQRRFARSPPVKKASQPPVRPISRPTVAQPTIAQPTVAQPTIAQPTVAQPVVEENVIEWELVTVIFVDIDPDIDFDIHINFDDDLNINIHIDFDIANDNDNDNDIDIDIDIDIDFERLLERLVAKPDPRYRFPPPPTTRIPIPSHHLNLSRFNNVKVAWSRCKRRRPRRSFLHSLRSSTTIHPTSLIFPVRFTHLDCTLFVLY